MDLETGPRTDEDIQLADAGRVRRLLRSRCRADGSRSGAHPDALPASLVTGTLLRGGLRGTALLVGLAGYGFSMAMMVRAGLGLDPWDVFHQGLALHTGMTIGVASAVVGLAVLVA